jgi:hypothetical protein
MVDFSDPGKVFRESVSSEVQEWFAQVVVG